MAPTLTAWGLIQAEPTVSDFAAAVQRFDLSAVLDTPSQPVTALVPTNAAIAALPDGSAILADPVAFEAFLRSHTVAGSLTTDQIFALPQLTTLSGDTIVVDPIARTLTGPSATPAGIQIRRPPRHQRLRRHADRGAGASVRGAGDHHDGALILVRRAIWSPTFSIRMSTEHIENVGDQIGERDGE